MSSDYNYDDQVCTKQVWDDIDLRTSGAILPILHTYHYRSGHPASHLLPPQTKQRYDREEYNSNLNSQRFIELENNAPRIKSEYKPEDEKLITGQKNKQWRRERRIKRFLATVLGYGVMGYMVYLIIVTQRIIPKIWDPYSILDISRVRPNAHFGTWVADSGTSPQVKRPSRSNTRN